MNYGRAIQIVRVVRGMTQKDLATVGKIDASYVSLIENGERNASQEMLYKIANALDVPFFVLNLLATEPEVLDSIFPEPPADVAMVIFREITGYRKKPREGG